MNKREKSANIRIAQYENNSRRPKENLLRKIAEVLDVNYRSLYEPSLYAAEDVMYTLFELDEHYTLKLHEVNSENSYHSKHMAISFNHKLLDEFLEEWKLRKEELSLGKITEDEYREWKFNWPQTTDDCGKHIPEKNWKKGTPTE